MLAFSIDYYRIFFRATQSVELFCAYLLEAKKGWKEREFALYRLHPYLSQKMSSEQI